MKYSSNNPSTLFCEQVSTVTSLFEKWNECERTVVMYALLKRLTYSSLKFLQFSIECNLTQNFGSQKNFNLIETNANCIKYLQKLINTYKSFPVIEISTLRDKDTSYYESDLFKIDSGKYYEKKEDILNDILSMLPLLRPGNEEAKNIYLSLIPLAVEDTRRQIVQTELVQQIFSYLLIHPAISNDDRGSLSYWLRHLEEHIQSSFTASAQQSFYILGNSNENLEINSLEQSNNDKGHWQAIAPPSSNSIYKKHNTIKNCKLSNTMSSSSESSMEWNVNILQIPKELCDVKITKLNTNDTSQNNLGFIYDNPVDIKTSTDNNNDDHHVSFSKNGIEILDFDDDNDLCKYQEQLTFGTTIKKCNDYLSVPSNSSDSEITLKTRRSNSLTSPIISSCNSVSSSVNNTISTSSENLTKYYQKPRSYSLSIENPRLSLTNSGSDTRLDDMKPNYMKFVTHNIGMSNIGQWLKSLRLHKYMSIFTSMTYEKMLEITEEYLQSLGVTKGASHKLALCIEKLKDRYNRLTKIETDIIQRNFLISDVIEELSSIVLTPMQPVDNSCSQNVAKKFLEVLDLVAKTIANREITIPDEESANALLWVLEKALHCDAFTEHTNKIKEHKFNLSKFKILFTPKSYHTKCSNSNGSISKHRWGNHIKNRKNDGSSKSGNNEIKLNRKNTNDLINTNFTTISQTLLNKNCNNSHYLQDIDKFSYQSSMQAQLYNGKIPNNTTTTNTTATTTTTTTTQYKSSSYPNFNANLIKTCSNPQHYRNHRHSLNNLIVFSANNQQQPLQNSIIYKNVKTQNSNIQLNRKNSDCDKSSESINHRTSYPSKSLLKTNFKTNKILSCDISDVTSVDTTTSKLSSMTISSMDENIVSNENNILIFTNNDKNTKNNNIGDINSSLEFLCLQMTEQAIN